VFYWLEGNPLQISDAHSPLTSLDIRCLVPLFLFNILGEGCFGGYIFPRQELAFKQYGSFTAVVGGRFTSI